MSILSTVLIYVIIPIAVLLLVAALVMAGSDRTRRSRRYRPGRPYDFQPIWFLASPEQVTAGGAAALGGRRAGAALPGPVLEDSTGARVPAGSSGGASDSW